MMRSGRGWLVDWMNIYDLRRTVEAAPRGFLAAAVWHDVRHFRREPPRGPADTVLYSNVLSHADRALIVTLLIGVAVLARREPR
jgi:hypothetical protein